LLYLYGIEHFFGILLTQNTILKKYISFLIHTEQEPLEGYIHSLSPMKTSKTSKVKYFNYSLQKQDETLRGVCFSPQKYPEMKTLEKTKSPVKLQNYKFSTTNDIIVDQKTSLSPLQEVPFAISKITTASDVTNIGSLLSVTAEQIITLKVEVTHIASVKTILTQHHGQLQKQEVMLRDPTGTIKLVLWEQYVDALVVNKTYVLENLKLKVYNDKGYLNSPKDVDFKYKEVQPFEQPLPEAEHVIDTPSITGKIVGIKDITTIKACTSCGKSTEPCESSTKLGQCQVCNFVQVLESCDLHWSLRLLVKASDDVTKRSITLFHQQILLLLSVLDINLNLNSVSVEELTISLLNEV
jgi:hypothetical protein